MKSFQLSASSNHAATVTQTGHDDNRIQFKWIDWLSSLCVVQQPKSGCVSNHWIICSRCNYLTIHSYKANRFFSQLLLWIHNKFLIDLLLQPTIFCYWWSQQNWALTICWQLIIFWSNGIIEAFVVELNQILYEPPTPRHLIPLKLLALALIQSRLLIFFYSLSLSCFL